MGEGETENTRLARLALARHQQRREQGIPTLGVLVGAPAEATAVWQEWARDTGRQASVRKPDAEEEGKPGEAVLYIWPSAVEAPGGPASCPGLAQTVERLCRLLEAGGAGQRNGPLALAVAPADAAAFLRDESFSRARALFAEGMVTLPAVVARSAPGRAEDDAAHGAPGWSAASLPEKWPLRPETAASFAAAKAALHAGEAASAGDEEDDRARSAAERFLFHLLNDLPETAGAFELNVRLGFCFGPMPAEVDLLSAGLRVAVEIDGFHHFRGQDNYRRDRRKDALLQRQGYLVLRFLAEDVVARLEEILEEIRTAVAFRRATRL